MVIPSPKQAETQEALEALADGGPGRPGLLVFLGAVLLPALTLGLELAFRMCRSVLFNPVPTPLHILMVALVPLANLALFLPVRRSLARVRILAWFNGAALGVSAFYTLIFLPLMPLGVVAIVAYGLGLLILAPSLALASGILLRRHLARRPSARGLGWGPGFAAALGLLLVIELPSAVTRTGMKLAAADSEGARALGLGLLRVAGDSDVMLRLCHAWPSRATDLVGFLLSFGKPVGTEAARAIYYRVLGTPFNSVPAPEPEPGGFFSFGFGDGDGARGGTQVAGMVPGLSLAASRLDASIDAQAGLAYQEWTLEFANAEGGQAEARAQIQLPPEGVVSRLTLWVDGEEREAAFAARGQVREAYERVVRARRDPVLVTTQGKDRVLMQCFPVPPEGRMRVRLGITSPLAFSSDGTGHFHLPRFSERNFAAGTVREAGLHSVWVESTGPMSAPGDGWESGRRGETHTLRALVSEAWLEEGRSFPVERTLGHYVAWTDASPHLEGGLVQQWAETEAREPLDLAAVVVDLSRGMRPHLKDVAAALRRAERPVRLLVASAEEVREYQGPAQRAGDWLERQSCMGGQDNLPALREAFEAAARAGAGTGAGEVLWIHASQGVDLSPPGLLRQSLERPGGPRLLAVQAGNGPARLLEEIGDLPQVTPVRLSGNFREELGALLSPTPGTRLILHRKRVAKESPGQGKRTSGHLAKLQAHAQVRSLLDGKDPSDGNRAVALASRFQLVTPVTGAVVLENASQYAAAGLTAPGAATVPGIPEPGTVALLVIVALVLLVRFLPRRRRREG